MGLCVVVLFLLLLFVIVLFLFLCVCLFVCFLHTFLLMQLAHTCC